MRTTKTLLCSICLLFVGLAAGYASAVDTSPDYDQVRASIATTYHSQLYVRETEGPNNSPEIRQYLAVTGVKTPAPYCAAFVAWCFEQHGVVTVRSAWSPDWFPKAKLIYTKGKPFKDKPRQADVFGIYYPELKRIAHVGFIDKWPPGDYAITFEANTNTNGSRNGNGNYLKRRVKSNLHSISRWV
jgi:hypothetical protein